MRVFTWCDVICRYDKQIKLLQREQVEVMQEHAACSEAPVDVFRSYMPAPIKYVANPEDRRLAQKHWIKRSDALKVRRCQAG